MHFYPDLHGLFLRPFLNRMSLMDIISEGNRSPIADPRMRGSIMGLTLVSSCAASTLSSRSRILMRVLGLFAARPRAQIRAHPRGDRAPDAAHRRQAQRRRTLHPRAVHLWVAGAERGTHAAVGERVQHARHTPAFARCVGRARCRDVGPLRDDA